MNKKLGKLEYQHPYEVFFKHRIAYYCTGLMLYIIKGGQVYHVPPCLQYWLHFAPSPVMLE